jgi:hypothetical protein
MPIACRVFTEIFKPESKRLLSPYFGIFFRKRNKASKASNVPSKKAQNNGLIRTYIRFGRGDCLSGKERIIKGKIHIIS